MKARKRNKPTRERDWAEKHDLSFTHDRARHRKAEAGSPPPPAPLVFTENIRTNAIVIAHSGQWAFVQQAGQQTLCLIDERLGDLKSSVLAPGDEVYIETPEGQAQPVVRAIAPRRTKLSRLAHVHSRLSEQVIAANVDVLVIATSAAQPAFKRGFVDRCLIAADVGGVIPLLVVNKMDLVQQEPPAVNQYRELGLTVLNTSCAKGTGIAALTEALRGRFGVVAGPSGTGKSSLLNAMDPSLDLATQEVSATTEKGRHTTTNAKLYTLAGGIRIIDTPGIRQLGLWDVSPEDLPLYFPDLAELATQCKFRNCTHTHEPQCAVLAAVESGQLSRIRYGSYRRIRDSL